MGTSSRRGMSMGFGLVIGFALLAANRAGAEDLRNPRLQLSLQRLEVARAQLDAAIHRYPPEFRGDAERAAREVDAAAHDITDEMAAMRTRRQIEPGRVEPTDHPARAARDAIRQALDELTRGVKDQDMKGRVRSAFDHERAALDRGEALARREAALPPPAVVEVRHPRLQRAIQQLELARAQLDAARSQLPPEFRDATAQAARDVDAAGHESADALAAAGAARTIGVARVEPSDRPLRAARDALRIANDELAAVAGDEFHGHVRAATERARHAAEEVDGLIRRDEGRRR